MTDKLKINKATGGLTGPNGEYVFVGPDGEAANHQLRQFESEITNLEYQQEPDKLIQSKRRSIINQSEKPVLGKLTSKFVLGAHAFVEKHR